MKRISTATYLKIAGMLYLASFFLFMHSCSVEKCVGVTCINGTCSNGTCNCNSGYEGADCKTLIRDKFLGNFEITSGCYTNTAYYKIAQDSATTLIVKIENLMGVGLDAYASISNDTTLIISSQKAIDGNGLQWSVSGEGSINSNYTEIKMNMSYVLLQNTTSQTCTETYIRK